jgi:hypothetical protein
VFVAALETLPAVAKEHRARAQQGRTNARTVLK